jgi:hypothetical protein
VCRVPLDCVPWTVTPWTSTPRVMRRHTYSLFTGTHTRGRRLRHTTYALEIPDGSGNFIDGGFENSGPSASDRLRSPAIFANHSRLPNCALEHWPAPRTHGDRRRRDMLWIVAKEDIAAGAEVISARLRD